MLRKGRSNTVARRYKGKPDTFRTDLVLSIARNYFFSCLWQHMDTTFKKLLIFWGYPRIDSFFRIFKRSEALLRQTMSHRSKQVVMRRRDIWRIGLPISQNYLFIFPKKYYFSDKIVKHNLKIFHLLTFLKDLIFPAQKCSLRQNSQT